MAIIRKFNEAGIRSFEILLEKFREMGRIDDLDRIELINDTGLSVETVSNIGIQPKPELPKLQVAKVLCEALQLSNNKNLYYDRGLWTWLAAYFLEALVVKSKSNGRLKFKENALYVLEPKKWTKYYRHLLAFPCWTFTELGEKGKILLRGNLSERGEIVEQLASARDIQRNSSIVEAASILFYDTTKDGIKKGAASKGQGGTVRRFREVIQQLRMTFDLNSMSGEQITKILPKEFHKWGISR